MKIVFGCDPNATDFKLQLMEYVKGLGHEVADFGSDDPITPMLRSNARKQ